MIFHVNSYWINLRSAPGDARKNIIARIPYGHEVRLLKETEEWWYVGTFFQEKYLEAYVSSKFFSKGGMGIKELTAPNVPEAHLPGNGCLISPASINRSFAINDPDRPKREKISVNSRVAGLFKILDYLEVEKSRRYFANGRHTYCHIYVQDFVDLAGAYIPRVWWGEKALINIASGAAMDIRKGITVHEMGARKLYDWFYEWGNNFGWKRSFKADEAQMAANDGHICILSAKRKEVNAPGHICLVLPESPNCYAVRNGGNVTLPVMSHAGNKNRKYFTHRWWTHEQFSFFGFWIAE